jgi:hypothetical protein
MSISTKGIIGGAAVGGIIITLISIGLLYLILRKKICSNKSDPDRDSGAFKHFDSFESDVSSSSTDSNFIRPLLYQNSSNEYTATTFNNIVYDNN